jgi:L-ascorbate metabolism protein UlaG (beta-lactamase superfamily)
MKIKKLGHCCLIIEENGKRIMTDPGSYTVDEQKQEKNLDLIIITHEHGDHIHIESLKEVVKNNPNAKVVTNAGVGKLLDEAGIKYEVLENKLPVELLGVELEAHDCKHEEIFEEIGQVQNTAYFIGKRLFYPGDAYYNPDKPIEILALPVAGPWAKVKDFITYTLEIKPKVCFPVHDGMLTRFVGSAHFAPEMVLPKNDIAFKIIAVGEEQEF